MPNSTSALAEKNTSHVIRIDEGKNPPYRQLMFRSTANETLHGTLDNDRPIGAGHRKIKDAHPRLCVAGIGLQHTWAGEACVVRLRNFSLVCNGDEGHASPRAQPPG